MTTIIQYQCDICGKRHTTEDAARKCESKGMFDVTPFRIGILWPNFHGENFVGIFSMADPRKYADDPHIGETSYLAFRTMKFAGSTDSTFETGLCGHDFLAPYNGNNAFRHFFGIGEKHWDGRWMRPEFMQTPEFIRACRYMVERGFQPMIVTESGETVDVVLTSDMIPDSMIVVNIPGGKYAIPNKCPKCSSEIGPLLFEGRIFRNGSVPLFVDQWNCNCKHVVTYNDIETGFGFRVTASTPTFLERERISKIDADESKQGNRKWE